MTHKPFVFAFAAVLLLSLVCLHDAHGAGQPPVSPKTQQRLAAKYPNQKVVNWCSGAFAGKEINASVVVLHDQKKKEFLVLWLMAKDIQELDTIPQTEASSDFELQCMNAKEAKELQDTLQNSEGISSSVEIPKDAGAVCYFIDPAIANCWSLDRATGQLVRVGAWEV